MNVHVYVACVGAVGTSNLQGTKDISYLWFGTVTRWFQGDLSWVLKSNIIGGQNSAIHVDELHSLSPLRVLQ